MTYFHLITGFFMVGLGLVVKSFPGLIAGYNTMSPEQRARVDVNALGAEMRNGLVIIGGLSALLPQVAVLMDAPELALPTLLITMIIGVFLLVLRVQRHAR